MIKFADGKKNCLICNGKASGIHNKIRSCRACAAFFKRAMLQHSRYVCRVGSGKCVIDCNEKNVCKACRFDKCMNVGMQLKDKLKNSISDDIREGLKFLVDGDLVEEETLPQDFIDVPINVEAVGSKLNISFNDILTYVENIFKRKKPAIKKYYNTLILNDLTVLKTVDLKNYIKSIHYLGKCVILTAEMLMEIPDFYFLPMEVKLIQFKHFWHIWWVLWIGYKPLEMNDFNITPNIIVLNEQHYMNITDYKFIDNQIPEAQTEAFVIHFSDFYKFFQKQIISPMKKIKITKIELAYIAILALWSTKDFDDIPSHYENMGHEILFNAGNELHRYFINNHQENGFVSRVTEITIIYENIIKAYGILNNTTIIADVCNFIHYSIFDNDLSPAGIY